MASVARRRETHGTGCALRLLLAVALTWPGVAMPAAAEESEERRALLEELEREMLEDQAQRRLESARDAFLRNNFYCLRTESEVARMGDVVAYKQIGPGDFRAQGAARREQGSALGIFIACIAGARIAETADGAFTARREPLRYLPLLDRAQSYWNPQAGVSDEVRLEQLQIYFELGRYFAADLNARRRATIDSTQGRGATPEQALERLAERWSRHMEQLRAEFQALVDQFNEELAKGGGDVQRAWNERIRERLRGELTTSEEAL